MYGKELLDFMSAGTKGAYIRGARAFNAWLIGSGHLSYKSEEDKQLIERKIR